MSKYIRAVAVFALFWLIAWAAGYDFQERNVVVAWWLVCSLIFSGLAYTWPGHEL